jgi:hypothetical protein
MSQPRFLADNDLNDAIVRGTRRREPAIEFVRLRELGLEKNSDRDVLAFAAREHWIVISHDVSSMTSAAYSLLAESEKLQGLLLVHQADPIASTIDSLVLIWSESKAEEWVGVIQYLPL